MGLPAFSPDFLLSPEVVLTMYGSHNTYPAMGSIMQAGAGVTYYSPDGHWELSGGYMPPTIPSPNLHPLPVPSMPKGMPPEVLNGT